MFVSITMTSFLRSFLPSDCSWLITTCRFFGVIAETVDYGHRKTGTRVSGLAFGGISFCQKLGMGIAGGLLGYLLSYFDYQADVQQSDYTLNGLALMATIIPAVFHLAVGANEPVLHQQ